MWNRTVYVISDLHLGGAPGTGTGRGFCMTTRVKELVDFIGWIVRNHANSRAELVINGDFLDFLAEEHVPTDAEPSSWRAFLPDVTVAKATATAILDRYPEVMRQLAALVAAGNQLTILLGNHDIELSFPEVRRSFAQHIGAEEARGLRFILDGEAYVIDSVLIEHGNRYDGFNAIAFDHLRELRSLQSRGLEDERIAFPPPPGSELVARIMNPLKVDYPFVDLLKPETSAVFPLLLALAPRYRTLATELVPLAVRARGFAPTRGAQLRNTAYVAAVPGAHSEHRDPVEEAVARRHAAAMQAVADVEQLIEQELQLSATTTPSRLRKTEQIAVGDKWRTAVGFLQLLLARDRAALTTRLAALRRALQALAEDRTWDKGHEPASEYLAAAGELARGSVKYVVFGHTHLAKDIPLSGDRRYLNTGTWADLARFPLPLPKDDDALEKQIRIFLAVVTHEPAPGLMPDDATPEDIEKVRCEWLVWEPHVAIFSVTGDAASAPQLRSVRELLGT